MANFLLMVKPSQKAKINKLYLLSLFHFLVNAYEQITKPISDERLIKTGNIYDPKWINSRNSIFVQPSNGFGW